jgi:hypothetical protein
MTTDFLVIATSQFERQLKKLAARHPELPELYRQAIAVLKSKVGFSQITFSLTMKNCFASKKRQL